LQNCRFAAVARNILLYSVVKERIICHFWLAMRSKIAIIAHIFYIELVGKARASEIWKESEPLIHRKRSPFPLMGRPGK